MKFDFCIGNPPYQDESIGDNKEFAPPVYDKFIDAATNIADRVELIHPARFLFDAGSTPKQWNRKMLHDRHFKILNYESDCKKVFANTDIKGGIVISYSDCKKDFGAIEIFAPEKQLNTILHKIKNCYDFKSFSEIVITRTAYRMTEKMHKDHPEAISQLSTGHPYDMSSNIFERLPQIFFDKKPDDGNEYMQILGRENHIRKYKYIRIDYVRPTKNTNKFKVVLPKASGNGSLGETLSAPFVDIPGHGTTETFITIGMFNNEKEATNCLKYICCKFTRVLLAILKRTQEITPEKWKFVPLQDFTPSSDIDWSKSIHEIDLQLYKKYDLSDEEINFIETHVKEMK